MALDHGSSLPATRDTTPFLLTSGSQPLAFTISRTGVPSAPQTFTTRDLINTLSVPIEITELHFLVTELAVLQGVVGVPGTWAGAFEVSLALGSKAITNGFTPLCGLEVRRDADLTEGDSALSAVVGHTVRWILAQPLILKPNEGISGMARISPNLTFPDGGAPQTCTVSFVARGRRLAQGTPVPTKRAIPHATGWIFTAANQPAPDATFQNNLGKVLHVNAIVATPTTWGTDAGPVASVIGTVTINSPGGLANTALRGLAASVVAGAVFSQRHALEEAHDMIVGEAHQITLSTPIADTLYSTGGTAVTLLGWREE